MRSSSHPYCDTCGGPLIDIHYACEIEEEYLLTISRTRDRLPNIQGDMNTMPNPDEIERSGITDAMIAGDPIPVDGRLPSTESNLSTPTPAPVVRLRTAPPIHYVHYKCSNSKCAETDIFKGFENEAAPSVINCWNCGAGRGMPVQHMVERRLGMFAYNEETGQSLEILRIGEDSSEQGSRAQPSAPRPPVSKFRRTH